MGSTSQYFVWINWQVRQWIRGKSLIPNSNSLTNYENTIGIIWEIADSLSDGNPIDQVLVDFSSRFRIAYCHTSNNHTWTGLLIEVEDENELFRCVILEDRMQIHIQEVIET